jgi:hypothetical protein
MAENSDLDKNADIEAVRPRVVSAQTAFEKAAQGRPPSLAREFVQFLMENKKWWLLPILLIFLLFGLLFASSGAAPFIYTLY